jgi:hypothetical protein
MIVGDILMAAYELLNSQQHSNLKLNVDLEKTPHFTPVVASEFFIAAASCPIVFSKDPDTGEFFAGVVLSLKPGEPAIKTLEERGGFNPLSLQCQGFYVSDQSIVIDVDNMCFSHSQGESLFTESQQPADCLRQIQSSLGKLHAGLDVTKKLIHALDKEKLIEPIDMALQFDDGERITLKGLYTVSLDALAELDDNSIQHLHRSGYLGLAYVVAASLKQFNVLGQLCNRLSKEST